MKKEEQPEAGYVYILTNPSFKDNWVKIGKSSRPVNIRSKELDNTAVPLPFEIYATVRTIKYERLEKNLHKTIDRLSDIRIRQNREFFNISPAQALELMKDMSTLIDDAVIEIYHNNKPQKINSENTTSKEKTKRHQSPRFKFSMVNIPIGSKLIFKPTNIVVIVADDDKIEYDGRIYRLSPFVGTFMPDELKNSSGAYQGAKYFTYHGVDLVEIRKRLEEESSGNEI